MRLGHLLKVQDARHDRPDWALIVGCWLLKHFQRIKNSFYTASAGRRNF
jgi:hypothetical protein